MLCVLCKTGELQGLAGIARGDLPRYHLSGIDRELIFRYGSDLVRRWAVLRRMTGIAASGLRFIRGGGKSAVHIIEKKR